MRRDRVTLVEVEALGLQALERFLHFLPSALFRPFLCFAAQEEAPPLARHPRTDQQFCMSVRRRDIDMVDTRLDDLFHHFIGIFL